MATAKRRTRADLERAVAELQDHIEYVAKLALSAASTPCNSDARNVLAPRIIGSLARVNAACRADCDRIEAKIAADNAAKEKP